MVCIQLLSKSCEKTGCHGYSEVFNRNCGSSPVSGKFRVWNVEQVTEELREKSHEESRIRQLGFDQLYIWTAGLYNNSRSWTGDENSKPGTKMFHEWREMPRSTEKFEEEKYVIIKIGVSKPQLWKRLSLQLLLGITDTRGQQSGDFIWKSGASAWRSVGPARFLDLCDRVRMVPLRAYKDIKELLTMKTGIQSSQGEHWEKRWRVCS